MGVVIKWEWSFEAWFVHEAWSICGRGTCGPRLFNLNCFSMTQPHHHVFNVLQGEINRRVKLAPLLPALQEAGIVPPEQLSRFKREDGMKYMTGYLRSRDYETFVTFIKCMYTTSESGEKNMAIVESVKDVVLGFDERNKTDHAKKIIEILESQKIEAKLTTDFQDLSLEESKEGKMN